jgi:cell division septum initiation protein DivIVA
MQPHETLMLRRLRNPELARSVRGYDETDTKSLLEQAATALETVYEERDHLHRETRRVSMETAVVPPDLEAIGRALLKATETGEQIVAAAQQRAEQLVAQATAQADAIRGEAVGVREQAERQMTERRVALESELEEERSRLAAERQRVAASGRAEADRLLTQARDEVERLRGQAEEITALIESKRTAFVKMAGAALEQLERKESRANDDSDGELLEALPKALPPVR